MNSNSSINLDEILNKLNNSCDDKIENIMNPYINKAIKSAKKANFDVCTIGYNSNINPNYYEILGEKNVDNIFVNGIAFWSGFIPPDIKIVYSFEIKNFAISNSGSYYYMNDFSYIYDFAKYIKGKEIKNDLKFLLLSYEFIFNYFATFDKGTNRDNLNKLIYKNNNIFYEPTVEHNISDFYGTNAAQCSEYSALLQNILSVFGYSSLYIFGEIDDKNSKNSSHAYNLAVIDNKYSLIDIAIPIACYDDVCKKFKKAPYIFGLDDFDEDNLNNFLVGNEELQLDDLESYIFNNEYYTFGLSRKRVYRVEPISFCD